MAIRVYSAAGPLAGYREGYRVWLASLGYAEATLKQLLVVCNQLNRYMAELEIELSDLDERVISRFVAARIEERYAQGLTCSFYARLLEYLRGLGVCLAAPQAHCRTPAVHGRCRALRRSDCRVRPERSTGSTRTPWLR